MARGRVVAMCGASEVVVSAGLTRAYACCAVPQFILEVLCAGDELVSYKQIHFCMHGVGHAFGYKDIFFPIYPSLGKPGTNFTCLPSPEPEVHDAKLSFDAAYYCNTVRRISGRERVRLCWVRALCGDAAAIPKM